MMTNNALLLIRDLAAEGHGYLYIANALTDRGIPTPSGRGSRWYPQTVKRLAEKDDIAVAYDPTKAKKARKSKYVPAVIRDAEKKAEEDLTRPPPTLRSLVFDMLDGAAVSIQHHRREADKQDDAKGAMEAASQGALVTSEAEAVDEMDDDDLRRLYGWLFRAPDKEAIQRIIDREAPELPPVPSWFLYRWVDPVRDEYEMAVRFGEVDRAGVEKAVKLRHAARAKRQRREYLKLQADPIPEQIARADKWLATVKGRLQSIVSKIVELEGKLRDQPESMHAMKWRITADALKARLPSARVELFEAQKRVLRAERGGGLGVTFAARKLLILGLIHRTFYLQ